MELLAGMPLSALLRRFGALSSARAVRITRLIAEALAALHAAGIVHRDLKPDNVQVECVDGVDAIKVVDFGLAKVMGQNRLTRAGVVFGTPHYMSPEQASGQSIDGRADLYSLGVVLYEMLVGRVPFEADTYMGVLTQHIYMKPVAPSVRLGNAAAFGAVEAVVLRCLQKQPEKRFQSSAELIAALEELEAGHLSEEPPAATAAPLVASDLALFEDTEVDHFEPRVPLRWVATLLAACAALGAAAALFFASSGRPAAVAPRAELARVAGPPAMHALRGAVDTLPAEASPVAPVLPAPPAPPPSAALSSATPDAGRTLTPTRAKHVGSTAKAVTPVTRSRALAGSDIIDPWAKSAPR
jgi:serine/threonine-protein kinase